MTIKKKIRGSERGLSFSFHAFGKFKPGDRYRYIIDKRRGKLLIVPVDSETAGLKVSRRLVKGQTPKSLFDIRNQAVRSIVSEATHLIVEIHEGRILVTACMEQKTDGKVLRLNEMLSVELSEEMLMAAGGENFCGDDVLSQTFPPEPRGDTKEQRPWDELPKVISTISLFAGAGMLDLPFSRDRAFKIVYAAELSEDAVRTYANNIGDDIVHQVSVRDLKGSELPEADIVIGGCPCQPYSNANPSIMKRGMKHSSGDLFQEYIRLIGEISPKLFLLENVPQFLTVYRGNMDYIREKLGDRYQFSTQILCDADVGGYTTRKRLFLIGCRNARVEIPDIKLYPLKKAGEAIQKVTKEWKNFFDVTLPRPETKKRIAMVPEGGNWRDLPAGFKTRGQHSNVYRRIDRNGLSPTICNWSKCILAPPRYDASGAWDRILTVAEAAALSGLDQDFTFYGHLSSMQQQVGNGVPYKLAEYVKNVIKKAFQHMELCFD